MKERLDILLVERRLTESRAKAKWLVRNGYVLVNEHVIRKPGKRVESSYKISLKAQFPYVGRGGLKLEAALTQFSINVENKICVDIGASIGGFTDCLLKHGASKVYAIDTATNLLHPSLICNKKQVVPLLGIDARKLEKIEEKVDIITVDITFSSLKDLLPNILNFIKSEGEVIVLVKPIFETEFYDNHKFEIITDKKVLNEILLDLLEWSGETGFCPLGIIKSPVLGKNGSIEFFIHFKTSNHDYDVNYSSLIRNAL
jgi:23S rRNA (cytidine1920-2'-O)/16S rRNA (cytidine1409-2'-O)-methyltransferase